MSDVVAAPAEATAPAQSTQPATQAPAAPKAPEPNELEAVLKKMGGLKVKAGGKEHVVDSIEKLMRYAQRGIPVEQELSQLGEQKRQLAPFADLLKQLRDGDDDTAAEVMDKLLGDKAKRVAERRLMREIERESKYEGMSERERQLAQQLDAERDRSSKLDKERKAFEEQQRKAQEEQQVAQLRRDIGTSMEAALTKMGLPPKLEGIALEFMKPVVRAVLSAGQPLDPDFLAERVSPLFDELLLHRTRNLEGEGLLKFMGGDVGKKFRAALLASMQPAAKSAPPPANGAPAATTAAPAKWDPRKLF